MKIKELYPEAINENLNYEYKSILNPDNPIKWAKTIIGYANGKGGTLFVGVDNNGEAFGLNLDQIDKTKMLIAQVNDRHIFPHAKINYTMTSTDDIAEHFVLAVKVAPSNSVVRYRDGDFNETVYIKGDANATPASPEDIIALSKRKYGVDNETTDIFYTEDKWSYYLSLCKEYRMDNSVPSIKELQNEEIVSKDGYVKSGFIMFSDDYDHDDTLVCCRLWKGLNKTGIVFDNCRLKGSLVKVFIDTIRFIERNTKIGWVKSENGGRKEVRSYPKEAVREALVNAIAHRDYSISGTQIDIDIYSDRIEIVSPGSWLLPKDYNAYPIGSIPSIRRNSIIAACLDVANLMERGGTGFQTMMESYKECSLDLQPVVSIYPGFLNLKLYDKLYNSESLNLDLDNLTDKERLIALLKMEGPQSVKNLQEKLNYTNRSLFLRNVINPLIEANIIYRDGNIKSPNSLIKIK